MGPQPAADSGQPRASDGEAGSASQPSRLRIPRAPAPLSRNAALGEIYADAEPALTSLRLSPAAIAAADARLPRPSPPGAVEHHSSTAFPPPPEPSGGPVLPSSGHVAADSMVQDGQQHWQGVAVLQPSPMAPPAPDPSTAAALQPQASGSSAVDDFFSELEREVASTDRASFIIYVISPKRIVQGTPVQGLTTPQIDRERVTLVRCILEDFDVHQSELVSVQRLALPLVRTDGRSAADIGAVAAGTLDVLQAVLHSHAACSVITGDNSGYGRRGLHGTAPQLRVDIPSAQRGTSIPVDYMVCASGREASFLPPTSGLVPRYHESAMHDHAAERPGSPGGSGTSLHLGMTDQLADSFGLAIAQTLDEWWAVHARGAPMAGSAQQRTSVVSCRPAIMADAGMSAGSGVLALLLSYPRGHGPGRAPARLRMRGHVYRLYWPYTNLAQADADGKDLFGRALQPPQGQGRRQQSDGPVHTDRRQQPGKGGGGKARAGPDRGPRHNSAPRPAGQGKAAKDIIIKTNTFDVDRARKRTRPDGAASVRVGAEAFLSTA